MLTSPIDHSLAADETETTGLTVLSYPECRDYLFDVLDFLPVQDLASVQNASCQFNTLASHPLLWQKFIANQPGHLGKYLLQLDWRTETRSINAIITARLLEKTSTRIDLTKAFSHYPAFFQALGIKDEELLICQANELRSQASELQANNIYCDKITQTIMYPHHADAKQIMRYLHAARQLESLLMKLVIYNASHRETYNPIPYRLYRYQPGSGLSFKELVEMDSLLNFEGSCSIDSLLAAWQALNAKSVARTTDEIHEIVVIEDIFQSITQSDILKAQSLGIFDKRYNDNLLYLTSPLLRLVDHLNGKQVLAIVKMIPRYDRKKLFAQNSYFAAKANLLLQLTVMLNQDNLSPQILDGFFKKLARTKSTESELQAFARLLAPHWSKLFLIEFAFLEYRTNRRFEYLRKHIPALARQLVIEQIITQISYGYHDKIDAYTQLIDSKELLYDILDKLITRGLHSDQSDFYSDDMAKPFKNLSNAQRLANTVQQLATSDLSNKQAILFVETLADTNKNFQAAISNSHDLLTKLCNYYKEQAATLPLSPLIWEGLTISKASRMMGALTGALLGGLLWLISYPLLVLSIALIAPLVVAATIYKIAYSPYSSNLALIIFSIALLSLALLATVISPLLACIHLPFLIKDGASLGYKTGLIAAFKNTLKLPWLIQAKQATSQSKSTFSNFMENTYLALKSLILWPLDKGSIYLDMAEQISKRLQDYHQQKTKLEVAAQHERPILDRLALKKADILLSIPSAQNTVRQQPATDNLQTGAGRNSLFATEIKMVQTLNLNEQQPEQAPDSSVTAKPFGNSQANPQRLTS